ncbi:GspH/FimT family pseudopilin [Saccharospirillum impatiens]|uniref:GspH/FimT family pseudopilin n=1 Tax=Saccharospirillum impatiens TaxID=169438 RepID=UPI0003FC567C|nr:GspH/FimT family pseudopilin [Saccharospirillum impatiens]
MRSERGFTLIELMITVGIIAVVAGIALPSFQTLIQNNRLTTTGNEALGIFQLARGEAIRNNRRVVVAINQNPVVADDEGDLVLFVDENRNGAEDAGDRRVRTYLLPNDSVSFKPLNAANVAINTVTFLPDGRSTVNASIHICDDRNEGLLLQIRGSGQSRLDGAPVCP